MDLNHHKEQMSLAFIHAVAAHAGLLYERYAEDLTGVDGVLKSADSPYPLIEFQAKATSRDIIGSDGIRFELKVDHHNALVGPHRATRVLVVVQLPDNPADWVSYHPDELRLICRGWWRSLRDEAESRNERSVTVRIAPGNVFDADGLDRIVELSTRGEI